MPPLLLLVVMLVLSRRDSAIELKPSFGSITNAALPLFAISNKFARSSHETLSDFLSRHQTSQQPFEKRLSTLESANSSQIDRCVHRYCRSTSYFWFDELMPQRLNSSEQTIAAKLYNGQDQLR
uniref:Secreted protein n=1 Tax=Ascaris lumbricoides TaxID=6252 RepID=A0A0M3HS70_ASCLU